MTSTSLDRAPASAQNFVRGKSGHVPFWPGGLDEALKPESELNDISSLKGLRTRPPGFLRGLRFNEEGEDDDVVDIEGNDDILEDSQVLDLDDAAENRSENEVLGEQALELNEVDELLPSSVCA